MTVSQLEDDMKQIFYTLIIFIFLTACNRDDTPVVIPADRTVIAYMAADNDMSLDALDDIEEMKQGFSETRANLVAFINPAGEAPYILEIAQNTAVKYLKYSEKSI
jgi:hypothetical protein